jgi:hypothetical protein
MRRVRPNAGFAQIEIGESSGDSAISRVSRLLPIFAQQCRADDDHAKKRSMPPQLRSPHAASSNVTTMRFPSATRAA